MSQNSFTLPINMKDTRACRFDTLLADLQEHGT